MTSYRHPENIQHSSSFCGQILIVLPRERRTITNDYQYIDA